MAKRTVVQGSTNVTVDVFIQDSSSTTGAGLTGLVYNSSGLTCYYREGATGTATALTLATQTVGGAHSDGGFVEIDATNMPGMYRLDLSDTIVSGTNPYVTIHLKGATNMAPVTLELELTAFDPFDSVRGGLTALPNANADAAGGLPISDAGGLDMDAILVDTNSLNDTKIPDTISLANINAQCDTALSDIGLQYLVNTALPTNWSTDITANSALDYMADDGTATYDRTTDSLQALRDRGDAAWTTGGGGGITDILNIQPLIPNDIDLANTATYRIGLMLVNSLDDLPTTGEITPGTIDIDRKAIGGTSWTSVVSGAACSELAGMIYYDEVFDSGTGYAEGDSIRVTFKSQKITVSANDYEISDASGRIFYTSIRQTMRGTDSAALASVCTEARLAELDAANIPADVDAILTDTADMQPKLGTPAGASISADIATIDGNVDQVLVDTTAIVADTNELQTDWADGGRLDLILDARASQSSVDVIDGNVDAILVDTNEIQGDLTNGGRLDLLIDAIKAVTDNIPDSGALTTIASNISAILTDTGTTLDTKINTIDSLVDTLVSGVITGTAQTGTLSVTQATTDLTGYADDQLIGRVIIWTSGAADGEATDITDYSSASGLLTFTSLTTSPNNGDTFKIV